MDVTRASFAHACSQSLNSSPVLRTDGWCDEGEGNGNNNELAVNAESLTHIHTLSSPTAVV